MRLSTLTLNGFTALRTAGVRAIVAASFARIYFRNAVNNGLLPIVCPDAAAAIEAGETLSIDLERGFIRCPAGAFPFSPLSPTAQSIVDAGGLLEMLRERLCTPSV